MNYLVLERVVSAEPMALVEPAEPNHGGNGNGNGNGSGGRRRRSWTIEEKVAIVREVEETGDPVAVVARRHGMNANHLFMWIARVRQGGFGRPGRPRREAPPADFIEVGIAEAATEGENGLAQLGVSERPGQPATVVAAHSGQAATAGNGSMEIVGANGRRVIVDQSVNVAVLMQVIRGLESLR